MTRKIYNWIKEKLRQIGAWISVIFAATVLASAGPVVLDRVAVNVDTPQDIYINGKLHTIGFTDDNKDENLIIRTDRQNYDSISRATVYFTVENRTRTAQEVDINFYFKDRNKTLVQVERLNVRQETVNITDRVCAEYNASTTPKELVSPDRIVGCEDQLVRTEDRYFAKDAGSSVTLRAFNDADLSRKVRDSKVTRKDSDNYQSEKSAVDTIPAQSFALYKAEVRFDPTFNEKFFIEAVGDKGAYGHLDPWFDSSWLYRKQITITGGSGAGTGYQVRLLIGETSGATGEDFDLEGNSANFPAAEDDGGDLRFTDDDETTELDFWVEDVTGSGDNELAYVWVEVADDLGSDQDIYVYYGNAGASNASDGPATFELFDDFDDASIDGSIWETSCSSGCDITDGSSSSIAESGGTLNFSDAPVAASRAGVMASTTAIDTSGWEMRFRGRRTDNGTYGNTQPGFSEDPTTQDPGTTTPAFSHNNNGNYMRIGATNNAETLPILTGDLPQNTWYRWIAKRESASSFWGTFENDDFTSTGITAYENKVISPSISTTVYPKIRSADGNDMQIDWIFVRHFNDPEPVFSTAGAEEQGVNVTTDAATAVDDSSATLNATLDIGEEASVTTYFNYGTNRINFTDGSVLYTASTTPETQVASTTFDADLTSLTTFKIYDYQGVATTSSTNYLGANDYFITGDISTTTISDSDFNLGTFSTTTVSAGSLLLDPQGSGWATTTSSFESCSDGSTTFTGESLWTQASVSSDDGDWQCETGTTGSSGTGATDGSDGTVFIYTETSNNQQCDGTAPQSDDCHIEADIANSVNGQIMFDYWYEGTSLADFKFEGYTGSVWEVIDGFSKTGTSEGAAWQSDEFADWTADDGYTHIRFSTVDPTSWSSDISLDNIRVATSSQAYEDGDWVSSAWSVGTITNVDDSIIRWATTTPANTGVTIKTAVNSSAVTPPTDMDFTAVTNGGTISGATGDLTGKYVWVKIELTTTDDTATPQVHDVWMAINQGAGGGARQRAIHIGF